MTHQGLDLCGPSWQFGQVPRRSFTEAHVNDLAAVAEWLPATVPGNVRTDLLALGRITDPFFAEGYKDSLWVEEVDWWYRRQLEVAPLAGGQRAFLLFEGIDYLSAVFVNGQERLRREGMFSRQMVEVTDALQAGRAEIAVRVWGSSALPRRQLSWLQRGWQAVARRLYTSWVGIYPDRSASLKCQMSFGWDFAPPIRTMGIWDEARLVFSGPVFMVDARVTARPHLPGANPLYSAGPAKSAPATLSIQLTLNADQDRPATVAVQVRPANFKGPDHGPFRFTLDLHPGSHEYGFDLTLADVALWYPWDRGRPNLYNVELTLTGAGGEQLDAITVRTGIRRIERQGWQFSINGQPEFMRGLNWVPADCFPGRLDRYRYQELLSLARATGANLLRVWGGGLREKQAFYDLCDELGLLVWQEFPFSCMFLGAYPRHPAYLALVKAECSAIVRQLRHHPALVVWCGGNEFSRLRNRPLLNTLAAVVEQHDGTRPFVPVSPGFDHGRDSHNWSVWHGGAPIRAYQAETAAFLSEFGLQALPHQKTLAQALPDPGRDWETLHADWAKLQRYITPFLPSYLPGSSGPDNPAGLDPGHLESQIFASQRAQAAALQTAIEHMRRRRAETGGICVWQFNEPWPAISWAIVDYFGRPKLAWQRLRRWYQPLLISLKFTAGRSWQRGQIFRAEIWAINDSGQAITAELTVQIDETTVFTRPLALPANSVLSAGSMAHRLEAAPRSIRLLLQHHNQTLAENIYDLDWRDETSGSFSQRLRRRLAGLALR